MAEEEEQVMTSGKRYLRTRQPPQLADMPLVALQAALLLVLADMLRVVPWPKKKNLNAPSASSRSRSRMLRCDALAMEGGLTTSTRPALARGCSSAAGTGPMRRALAAGAPWR